MNFEEIKSLYDQINREKMARDLKIQSDLMMIDRMNKQKKNNIIMKSNNNKIGKSNNNKIGKSNNNKIGQSNNNKIGQSNNNEDMDRGKNYDLDSDCDKIIDRLETMSPEMIERLYQKVKLIRRKIGVQKSIQKYAKELSSIINSFNVYFCEDSDPDCGQCKIEFEVIFKDKCIFVVRFVISYLLIAGKYVFGQKAGDKIQNTVLLFDPPNNKQTTITRGNKLYEISEFNQQQLYEILNTILTKNNININNHNTQLMHEFVQTMILKNIPTSKYFKEDIARTLKSLV